MARQTTKRKTETPENLFDYLPNEVQSIVKEKVKDMSVHDIIKHEHGIEAMRAEIDRLNWVIRRKDLIINNFQKANEQLSHELSEARNGGDTK